MSSERIAKNSYIDFNGTIQLNNFQTLTTADKEKTLINKDNITRNHKKIPFTSNNSNKNSDSLLKAIEVHNFLISNENLTNNEKLNYCKIGRYFMKAFLKEVVRKYDIF